MPKTVTKTLVRSVTAAATGGLSELGSLAGSKIGKAIGGGAGDIVGKVVAGTIAAGGMSPTGTGVDISSSSAALKASATVASMKPYTPGTAPAGLPGEDPALQAEREQSAIDNTKLEERRRRQLLARQGDLVKTSPLGAAIKQNKLGGPSLTGY